jgi:SAM-dependent methyltransferase
MIRTQISYLPPNTNVKIDFPRWVFQYCGHTAIVLDVGAGNGRTGHAALIQQKVTRLVGVDPDMSIAQNPYLDERYQTSLEEFAKDRDSCFDCLYTTSVLEHVTHPREFLSACRSLLKPSGMLFSVTPNLWHYFGMATKLSSLLGIEDWLLDRLIGSQAKNSYHFPTVYRLNSIPTISRMLAYAGFQKVEFKLLDPPNAFMYCLPRGLHWFPSLYSGLVYRLKVPQIMGLLMFRATA